MSSKTALFKRKPKEVEVNGEKIHVRSLTIKEAREFEALEGTAAMLFALQCSVVESDGTQTFTSDDGMDEIPLETVKQLFEHISKVSAPNAERAVKN
jgi:hypothetical protein